MKRAIVGILVAVCGTTLGCREDKDREYLLARGFKPSPDDRNIYKLEHVRLGDVSRDLGFPLLALEPVIADTSSDHRGVQVNGRYFVIKSEVRNKAGRIVEGSLDDPNAICTVSTALVRGRLREYVKPQSDPRMRIISVTVPKDRDKPLQITFELAADGATPLKVGQTDIAIGFASAGRSPKDFPRLFTKLPDGTPVYIIVSPGKPIVLTAISPRPIKGGRATRERWSDLPPGEYVLCVGISSIEGEGSNVDYYWVGIKFSDDYKLVVK